MVRFARNTLALLTFALLLAVGGAIPALAAPMAQVEIEDVGSETPAEAAGLQAGDIILAFDGTFMASVDQLAAAILAADPGDTVTLNILRDGDFLELTATLAGRDGRAFLGIVPSRPAEDAPAPAPAEPTATPAPEEEGTPAETPTPDEEFMPTEVQGAVIADVVEDSPAARAGIQPGDIITAVEGEAVTAENDLSALITQYAPDDEVGITFRDPTTGDEMTVVVTLGENPSDATQPFLGVRYMMPGMELEVMPQPTTPAPDEEETREATPVPDEEVTPEATPGPDEETAPDTTPVPEEETPEVVPAIPQESLALPTDVTGALVGAVLTDGPADLAGILPGDVITAVEDEAVTPDNDLAVLISQYDPGDEVGITLIDPESGEEVTIVVELGENPSDPTLPFLGVRYIPIEAEATEEDGPETDASELDVTPTPMAEEASEGAGTGTDDLHDDVSAGDEEEQTETRRFRPARPGQATPETEDAVPAQTPAPEPEEDAELPVATPEATEEAKEEAEAPQTGDLYPGMHGMLSGALVGRVGEGSPAAAAGIRAGDIIMAVDGVAVDADNDLATLIGQYAPEDRVELTVMNWRQDGERLVTVTMGENPDEAGKAFLGVSYMPLDMEHMMPRGQRGSQDGSGPMAPFLRHHGMDLDEFMQHLGCSGEDAESMPPYCDLFQDMPK